MYWIEMMIIDEEMVKDRDNYNQTLGGRGGFHHCNTKENVKKRNQKIRESRSKMTPEENHKSYGRDQKGSKNSRSKTIKIYNSKDKIEYTCNGNWIQTIEEHNLPKKQMIKSLQEGTKVFHFERKSGETRVANQFGLDYINRYKGWYALAV